jgi:hypothetical protein
MANEKHITSAAKANKSQTKSSVFANGPTLTPSPSSASVHRLGFMAGQMSVPDDFDQMGSEEIARIFSGGGEETNKF